VTGDRRPLTEDRRPRTDDRGPEAPLPNPPPQRGEGRVGVGPFDCAQGRGEGQSSSSGLPGEKQRGHAQSFRNRCLCHICRHDGGAGY